MPQQKSSLAIRGKGQDSLCREVDIMGKPSREIISTKLIVRIITKLVRSTIGSGVLLYDDLESDMRVLVKQEHIIQNKKIKENQSSLDDVSSNSKE